MVFLSVLNLVKLPLYDAKFLKVLWIVTVLHHLVDVVSNTLMKRVNSKRVSNDLPRLSI